MFLQGLICKFLFGCGQELLSGKNAGDLGRERKRGVGELRDDDEKVPFYLLPMAEKHRGGRNRR
jgi:hypothetical protein